MKKIIVAIDGHAGCGKSSTAKVIANKLEYTYIDTGAMYRAVTLNFLNNNIDLANEEQVEKALEATKVTFERNGPNGEQLTFLNGENVENQIRDINVSKSVSAVSAISVVRKKMVAQQREMGKQRGVIMDGRDIGTVVFPDAEVKIFMTSSDEVRAQRRMKELLEKDMQADYEEILHNLKERDTIDSSRADSPLVKANDAITIDTSTSSFKDQVEEILKIVSAQLGVNNN
jgi:cytidylate kinase